jgi:monovalent cation/proton antiporter MnhG/PhaG subunit
LIDYLIVGLLVLGTFFVALGAVGLLRLPDVYSRMHAVTKATTLGMGGLLGASGLFFFFFLGHSVLGELATLWLVFLTNPVGGHMIAKSAYLIGVPMADISVLDEFGRSGALADSEHDTD